ncbi:MAG: MFS transporter [Myxococcales bacterium]|nr:MFS transporter [Polyangiaceae bacterium]MDW8251266.1 MFS transporter [Myxococcales bacterium]
MLTRGSFAWKITVLSSLYFVQGLPAGFQATALPTYLRKEGVSTVLIGFLGALALPWSMKVLWAPLVDGYYWPSLGKRRSWILPMQGLLLLCCAAAALVPHNLPLFLGLALLMNLCAATMDIAVDGLAVDILTREELGHGNASQVVGYKVGMLTGGGLLMWATDSLGFRPLLLAIAGLVGVVLLFTLLWNERSLGPPEAQEEGPYRMAAEAEIPEPTEGKVQQALRLLMETFRKPGSTWVLLYIVTYKTGETLVDVMFKPFLVDAGYMAKIGLWLGTYGMVASLLGSLLGGWMASRWCLWRALLLATVLRAGPVFGEWWLALGNTTDASVLAVTLAEHFFGGVLTTIVFAFMMGQVDSRIGGTHFTLLATLEVLGKAPMGPLSGILVYMVGYKGLFALGSLLSLAVIFVVIPLHRRVTLV